MYNSTFQVSYRRKVYEEVATLAYQRMNKEAFKWLPDWIVSVTGGNDAKEDIFSDLDYAAELCSAALGMEPSRYLDTLADKTPLEQTNDPAAPMVCVLSTMCHKCTQTQDAAPCLSACANHAIKLDATGRATINPSACSSCGTCVQFEADGIFPDSTEETEQIVRVEERDTEYGSHGGTDHLRVVDIHSITAHNESRDPRALSGSQDRSQVSWILKIFQHHQMSWTVTL